MALGRRNMYEMTGIIMRVFMSKLLVLKELYLTARHE